MADDLDTPPSLSALQQKIDAATRKEEKKTSSTASDAGLAARVGIELVAGVTVGSVSGYFVDRWLGTMPLFLIICFFLGAAAGVLNLKRLIENRDDTPL